MTISDEIDGLRADRDSIRAAIVGKGGTLPEGSPMTAYPAAIEALPSGGGGAEPVTVPYSTANGSSSSPKAFLSIAKAVTNLDGFMLDTSQGTTFTYMFNGCTKLATVPQLDTSQGTTFTCMFSSCASLTSVPALDTSKSTGFAYMFYNCSSLTSVPALDTSKSTTFADMFYNCSSLATVPQLDTSRGTDFAYMFYNCSSLTQIGIYGFRYSISISDCKLDADALNAFFTQAGTASGSQTITITGNPGAEACDKSIATNKGWTVTG